MDEFEQGVEIACGHIAHAHVLADPSDQPRPLDVASATKGPFPTASSSSAAGAAAPRRAPRSAPPFSPRGTYGQGERRAPTRPRPLSGVKGLFGEACTDSAAVANGFSSVISQSDPPHSAAERVDRAGYVAVEIALEHVGVDEMITRVALGVDGRRPDRLGNDGGDRLGSEDMVRATTSIARSGIVRKSAS